MKRYIQSFFLMLTIGLVMTGCKPEELVLDPAPSKLDGINDTFTLVEVKQVDNNGIALTELDVSGIFIGNTPATISFNSNDKTWNYSRGSSLNFLGSAGQWAFDNDDYPTRIMMTEGATVFDLVLVRTIRPQEQFLEVELTRPCGDGATGYRYKFARN